MKSGQELIILANALALALSEDICMDDLMELIELTGLLKHNLEVIRASRIFNKIDDRRK